MSATGPSSQWDDNVQPKITPNPYAKLLDHVNRVTFPEYTGPVRKVLLAFGCIHAVTALVCITVMLIPLRRSPEARKKLTWLLRKKYVASISTPYHVMNSGLVVVAAQLISSLVFVTYIILDYYSLNSTSFALRACLHVWLNSGAIQQSRAHHIYVVILFLKVSAPQAWSVVLVLGIKGEADSYYALAAHLEYGSDNWQPGQSSSNPIHKRAVYLLGNYVDQGKYFSNCWIWSSRTWSAIGISLALFYALNVANLLYVLRQCLKASQTPHQFSGNARPADTLDHNVPSYCRENLESPTPRITLPEVPMGNSKKFPRSIVAQPSVKELKNGYIYLIVHCTIMLLDLCIHVTTSTIRTVHYEQSIVDKGWRSRTTWLVLLGSTLASLAMIFHSWRIFTERDKTNVPEPNPGILVRKFLTSHREGPEPDSNTPNFTFQRQKSHETEPSKTDKLEHNVLSKSSTPTSDWSINPMQPSRSPPQFSALDDINRYTSYEMPPISERDKLGGYLCVPSAHVS
ncbi:uncharacterized protein PGTG_10048 [Puccinia graminis f. sp. tritici CRL 75-36-700-3]|uniref:Uncharacterized protein n=1 Tax=Puccinia graminis f. sp. tritici (strain CRL 75-36-700-3 / race SCCL) TaxID=418459 RepID=E3KJ53_PUCGT|nr:uncharacterized protein PGTG_10048 [Puccinia graminis f. sp. tritici CRL 75-36-700-3]EFP84328.2 hypothetical protein PGTG_10048 [Puccinia graminis f. sp. tritici CRL 75-36-700-3]